MVFIGMKLLDFYRSRKYFMRLLLSFTLLVSVFLIVFCSLLYSFSKNSATKLQQESTRKVLRQVNYNIDNLYSTVTNLTISTFSDRDISVLMQSRDIDIFELYNRLQKFDYITNTNLFIDSIIIYNAHNGCYYISPESIPVQCDAEHEANLLQQVQSRNADFPNLKLIPFRVEENGRERLVLTMFKQEQGSILMVNVKPQWLFDNASAINELADRMLGEIVIVSPDNEVLSNDSGNRTADGIDREIIDSIRARGEPEGHFLIGRGKDKKMVMYITSHAAGWKLVGIQSYQVVFGSLSRIGTFSLFLLSCFILLSLVASTVISMQLYKPIGSLIRAIRGAPGNHDGMGGGKDELTFLTLFNQRMLEKMANLETGKKATENIAKDYFLRRLLLERKKMSPQEFAGQASLHGLMHAEEGGAYRVCLLMIVGNQAGIKSAEQQLHRFAVQNIAEEIFAAAASTASLQLNDDRFAMLLSAPFSRISRAENELPNLIEKLKEVVQNYYKIGLCVSVSSIVRDHGQISHAYEQALLQFEYRMIYGKTALLTPELVEVNERNPDIQLDDETEKKWLACIRSGDMKKIEIQLVHMFRQLSTFRHDHLFHSLQYLTAITVNVLKEMNVDKAHTVKASLLSFNRRVLERVSLDDILVLYMELFQEIVESRRTSTDDKNRILADALKEAVQKHYADPNLSLQFLATKLKMSTAHLSKVFKQFETASLNDYINKVRIARAAEELQNTDQTITQIMYNVGFVSESYFYKIFKQSLGLTPREFRTKHVLSEE
jgi:AraC-like DNA-binding protein